MTWENINGDNKIGSFNGKSTYIDSQTNIFNGLTDFTISTWIKLDSVSGDDRIVSTWGVGDDPYCRTSDCTK